MRVVVNGALVLKEGTGIPFGGADEGSRREATIIADVLLC